MQPPKEPKQLRDKKQVVAGMIIFYPSEEGAKYLFLYRRGNYWNFPKGHFEAGEDSLEAALREVAEETGLTRRDLRVIPNFQARQNFSFVHGNEHIHDTVVLYLAETRNPRVVISPREHSGYAWFLYHDALRMLTDKYAGTKQILRKVHSFLRDAQLQTRNPNPRISPSRPVPPRPPITPNMGRAPSPHYFRRPARQS
ncbi:MAG: NUDIX domain-containing protein [Candidatus Liptonbacteria bacterium]|nr:NUDIX domain-containing protein [Candidatus Liptonbacteria bacterium]